MLEGLLALPDAGKGLPAPDAGGGRVGMRLHVTTKRSNGPDVVALLEHAPGDAETGLQPGAGRVGRARGRGVRRS